jgi:hypothetical protein
MSFNSSAITFINLPVWSQSDNKTNSILEELLDVKFAEMLSIQNIPDSSHCGKLEWTGRKNILLRLRVCSEQGPSSESFSCAVSTPARCIGKLPNHCQNISKVLIDALTDTPDCVLVCEKSD